MWKGWALPCEYVISKLCTLFFPFNPIAIDQHVLHISTSYASPEFTVGICCLLLHLQVVSPISYLLGSECSSFLHRSGASPDDSLRPSARYDQFDHRFTFWINAGTTAPWALDFLDVCCCLVVFFLRTWTGIVYDCIQSLNGPVQPSLTSMSKHRGGGRIWSLRQLALETQLDKLDSSEVIIYTILEVRSYLLGCY